MRQLTWRRSVILRGRRVTLRTARGGDQAILERLRADPEIDHFMGIDGPAATLLWRHVYLGDQSGALLDLVITAPDPSGSGSSVPGSSVPGSSVSGSSALRDGADPGADRPIGLVSFWDRTIPHEAAEVSIWLGQGYRDGGNGTEALRLALRHAFGDLKLHKVYLRVLEFNARAIRAYQKVGFRTEGLLREEMRVQGAWHNLVYMGVLAPEFALADQSLGGTSADD